MIHYIIQCKHKQYEQDLFLEWVKCTFIKGQSITVHKLITIYLTK